MPRDWWLDELAHAGAEHLDPDYVGGYDRKTRFDPSGDLDLVRDHGLDEDSVVVDLGCGTGTFALAVAPFSALVVAVDVSPPMLERVRVRAAERGVDNVTCVRAGLLTYEHRGAAADVVYSRNAMHQIPDAWKAVALARIAAILRPGGLLRLRDLVFSFEPDEIERHAESWLEGAADDPAEGWTREEYATHLREEHSTFSWLLETMLERVGLEPRQADYSDDRMFASYLAVKRP